MKKNEENVLNGMILKVNVFDMEDKKTGEVITYSKILYCTGKVENDYVCGTSIKKCTRRGNLISKLKDKCMKPVQLKINEKPTEDGAKYIIRAVDGVEL